MKVRHYFSTKSLEENGLRIALLKNGHGVYDKDGHVMIAEAWPEGAYFYTTTTGQELPRMDLKASVSHMTRLTFENHTLTEGHYCGEGWKAELTILGNGKTQVDISVTGSDVSRLESVHQKLVTGQLLPSFVVEDKRLTSEQVAAIVYGNGDRELWLSIVQSAQDTILRTATLVKSLEEQVAALQSKLDAACIA